MKNLNFSWENPLEMVIFHSYISLPEGKPPFSYGFPMVFPLKTVIFPQKIPKKSRKIGPLSGLRQILGPPQGHHVGRWQCGVDAEAIFIRRGDLRGHLRVHGETSPSIFLGIRKIIWMIDDDLYNICIYIYTYIYIWSIYDLYMIYESYNLHIMRISWEYHENILNMIASCYTYLGP